MSKSSADLQGQYAFSGRTIGKGLRKRRGGSNGSSEHRPLRRKTQPEPRGKNRFPQGYRYRAAGTWETLPDGKERYVPSPIVYPGC